MKCVMLLITDPEWEAMSDAERDFASIVSWWTGLVERGVMRGGEQLQPASTAKSIRWREQQAIVTDGPYMEAKESVGGFGILEVDSLEQAIEIARSWPATRGHRIELRPVVSDSG